MQKTITESKFWDYIEDLEGDSSLLLSVVPQEDLEDFYSWFDTTWRDLIRTLHRIPGSYASDDGIAYISSGIIRQGKKAFDAITALVDAPLVDPGLLEGVVLSSLSTILVPMKYSCTPY